MNKKDALKIFGALFACTFGLVILAGLFVLIIKFIIPHIRESRREKERIARMKEEAADERV